MTENYGHTGKMLLHACCGPCSLEPVRVLRERGMKPDIYYANSNIAPADEYERRLNTIREWARFEGIDFTEGEYDPTSWTRKVGKPWSAGTISREERCRACYRLRFEESAAYAKANGYESLGTTLSVSPYQYTDVIREELERACEAYGLEAAFEDWRPFYNEATRRSREAGMYRQNYCGCAISAAEAEQERTERKALREAMKASRAAERAKEDAELEKRRAKRREYDEKRARQRAVLKAMREKDSSVEAISDGESVDSLEAAPHGRKASVQ